MSRLVFSSFTFALMLALTATSAPAEATRPLMRTALAIKNLKLSIPVPLEKATKNKEFLGLDLEDERVRTEAMKLATDYVAYRHGRLAAADLTNWLMRCEDESGHSGSPLCKYERERGSLANFIRMPSASATERPETLINLREGKFSELAGVTYQDVHAVLHHFEESSELDGIADRIVTGAACVPPSVAYAIGFKYEEQFPQPAAIERTKKLYKKAFDCGIDSSAASAGYRLGLINIWQNHCADVPAMMQKIAEMPDGAALRPHAEYWRYHCAGVNGDESAKGAAKLAVLREHPLSFQALAVSGDDESSLAITLAATDPQIAVRSLIRPEVNVMIRTAEALIRAGAPNLATELIDHNLTDVATLEPEVRLYLAVVLNRIGSSLTEFKLLTSLFQDVPRMISATTMRLFFPLEYLNSIKARGSKVDPLLILSLIRQESAFEKQARSPAGARGLMQVMPKTARSIASVGAAKLFDPSTNIRVGTKVFSRRLGEFGGDVEYTLAAYNAGEARVEQWRKRYPTDNKMLFIDLMPYKETREYVSSILRNYYWYVRLYSSEISNAAIEGVKNNLVDAKVLAIMNANAGAAATSTPEK